MIERRLAIALAIVLVGLVTSSSLLMSWARRLQQQVHTLEFARDVRTRGGLREAGPTQLNASALVEEVASIRALAQAGIRAPSTTQQEGDSAEVPVALSGRSATGHRKHEAVGLAGLVLDGQSKSAANLLGEARPGEDLARFRAEIEEGDRAKLQKEAGRLKLSPTQVDAIREALQARSDELVCLRRLARQRSCAELEAWLRDVETRTRERIRSRLSVDQIRDLVSMQR